MRLLRRDRPLFWLAGGAMLLTALGYLLVAETGHPTTAAARPLRVYCAAALKPVMLAIAAAYEHETGVRVEFDFGDSGTMLGNATVRPGGDLFLPADDSFVRLAEGRGLVAEAVPLCRMRAVVLVRPGNPRGVNAFDDLLDSGLRVGIANPDRAAIGKVVRDHLRTRGQWDALAARLTAQFANVTDSANAVELATLDAAIVWDSVAVNYPGLGVVKPPELAGAVGRVELAVLKAAPDPAAARRFALFVAASDRGLSQFRKAGFADTVSGRPWVEAGGTP